MKRRARALCVLIMFCFAMLRKRALRDLLCCALPLWVTLGDCTVVQRVSGSGSGCRRRKKRRS